MSRLITLFWSIAIFKSGPQDLPFSAPLMRWTLLINAITSFMILQMSPTNTALPQVLVDLLLSAAYIWPLLYFAALKSRFTQTWTAWLGTDVIINLFAIAPLYNLSQGPSNWNSVLLLLLLVWHIAVYGHILRQALDRGWTMGIGLGLFYMMLTSRIMGELFPVITQSTQ